MAPAPDPSIQKSLDGLLLALEPERLSADRYRFTNEPSRFPNLFGGQLVAQAQRAMDATVDELAPSSIHAYFVGAGLPAEPVEVVVDRVRDGRSLSTRRATVLQGDRCLLTAIGSFHTNEPGALLTSPVPAVPAPGESPTLQDWAREALDLRGEGASRWIDCPPPFEMRMVESPTFLTHAKHEGPRSYWLRLPQPVSEDPRLHAALVSYASDYFLVDAAVRNRPDDVGWSELVAPSADHAVWLHRPTRLERWHLCTQQTLALDGDRALVKGQLRDGDVVVATVAQEILMRRSAPRPDATG
jgi:acyl-CoA thioesterase-2